MRDCAKILGKKFAIMMLKHIEDIRLQQNLTTKFIDGVLVKLERRE